MLFRLVVMLSVAALALALAACAETGATLATVAAEQAAAIAATRAAIATTEAINQLQAASTQMSTQGQANQLRGLPRLPPIGKGTVVIFTPDLMIVQKNGTPFVIVRRENYQREEEEDNAANQ